MLYILLMSNSENTLEQKHIKLLHSKGYSESAILKRTNYAPSVFKRAKLKLALDFSNNKREFVRSPYRRTEYSRIMKGENKDMQARNQREFITELHKQISILSKQYIPGYTKEIISKIIISSLNE